MRPRIQWAMLAADVLGALCLAALIVSLFWAVPIFDAMMMETPR
jgi:hypothetical protein